jgi:hypothetical protein
LPNDGEWFDTARGTGVALTTAVKWELGEELRAIYDGPTSAWTTCASPKTMEESTPSRGQKLPSRPYRPPHADYDDEDEDE